MKIAILSQGPRLYSTRRIKEAAEQRGHKVRVLNTLKFSIDVEQKRPRLVYKGRKLEKFDAVVPRIGSSITFFGTAVVRQFEQMGVFCANTAGAIANSRDKLRSIQMLSRHNVGIPRTIFVKQSEGILPAIDRLGGAPVVIKLLEGTQGIGVILAETNKIAEAIIETLHSTRQNVLIQQFIKESKGTDVRAFVVGGKVVGAMKRTAKEGEFRSNVHRGGRAEKFDLPPEYERTAIQAAQIMGLRVAGVDMLEGKKGPQIMEVNSSPGLEGIEGATGIDIAGEVVRHIEDEVQFPDVDIRQRLTLKKGYGVAEIPVSKGSALVGKSIKESGLKEADILVLSIIRDKETLPNPLKSREIQLGDRLLCFGKLSGMKSMLTHPEERRKKYSRKMPKK